MSLVSMSTFSRPISIWVLHGAKAGDNTQLLALGNAVATACHGVCAIRQLRFRRTELLTNLLLRTTLAGLAPGIATQLAPPWPDLIITAGRRNEPVARWIQRAADGAPKLVHIGRPWANPALFDLVITTPQYFVPAAANVLPLDLPLLPRRDVDAAHRTAAAQRWQKELAALPRPWVAALIGGDSGPFRLTVARTRLLAALLRKEVHDGSTLLVATSSRTSAAAVTTLKSELPLVGHFFDWHHDQRVDNPYQGYLALADRFVVTAESASMLAEACATQRPVAMFDLATRPRLFESWRWKPFTFALGQLLAPRRLRRDIGRIQARLVERQQAYWLGTTLQRATRSTAAQPPATQPFGADTTTGQSTAEQSIVTDELDTAVARTLQLFTSPLTSPLTSQ